MDKKRCSLYDSPRPCEICGKVATRMKIFKTSSNIIVYKCEVCCKETSAKTTINTLPRKKSFTELVQSQSF